MELQQFLNKQNRQLLNNHIKRSDKIYNDIIAKFQELDGVIQEEKLSTRENKVQIEALKKQTFEEIEKLLAKDTMLLVPLLFSTAIYAYNGHIKALSEQGYEKYVMRKNDVYHYDEDVRGKHMNKALKDNVNKFKMHIIMVFANYRNKFNKDFERASKRFRKQFRAAYDIYKRKLANILWQETRRVSERFKYLSIKLLNKVLNLDFNKQWITRDDDRVRDTRLASHTAMNNVKIKWDKEFNLVPSGQALFPRGSGIPVQDINCRCILKYSVRGA